MKKIAIILILSIFIIIFSTIASAASVNCTYGVDFINNSAWTINGNNITICDHENLDLSNVSITLQDNAQLMFNYSNVTIYSSSIMNLTNNSELLITNSYYKIDLSQAYDNSIIEINNSNASDFSIKVYNNSELSVINSTLNSLYTFDQTNSTLQDVTLEILRSVNPGTGIINVNNLYLNTTMNASITSPNYNFTITFTNVFINDIILFSLNTGTSNFINVSNVSLSTFDSAIANIYNSTIHDGFYWGTAYKNIENSYIIDAELSQLSTINITNTTFENLIIKSMTTLNSIGNLNNINNLSLDKYLSGPIIINGNITPTTLTYLNDSVELNRSYLVRLERPVAGYSVCLLENLTNTNDCYYTNTTNSNGEALVYIYFQNSSDTDYLYIQYQNQSVIANVTADYLITATADVTPPTISINVSSTTIYGSSFTVNVFTENASSANYTIKQNSNAWSYDDLTINNSNENETITFQGIYLPTGNWNITVTASDEYNNTASTTNSSITSYSAILATLVGNDEQTAYIGGSTISFTFNVTTKGYPYVKGFLNLSNGEESFNTYFANLYNGTNEGRMSNYANYSDAEAIIVPLVTTNNIPNNIDMNSSSLEEIYQLINLQMRLQPYSGLSAGDYEGSYGFGLDDGS